MIGACPWLPSSTFYFLQVYSLARAKQALTERRPRAGTRR